MDILQETISRHLPADSKHSSKCITLNCPCCLSMGESRDDTRGRGGLFLEPNETGYNCFNCGFKFKQPMNEPLSKRVKTFLSCLNVNKTDIQKILFVYKKNEQTSPLSHLLNNNKKKKVVSIDLNFKDGTLPKDTHLLHDIIKDIDSNHPAFNAYTYAMDRDIHNYPYLMWSGSKDKNLSEYLIIPYIYKKQLVGYQARYCGNNNWYEKNRRFINHNPNTGKFLFGLDNLFSEQKYIFINESAIDSIPYKGVGTMSHTLTNDQINILNSSRNTKILVPDFGKGGLDMVDIAVKNEWNVYFPFWDDGKDLGDATQEYGRFFMVNEIIHNSINSPSKIKLLKKKLDI